MNEPLNIVTGLSTEFLTLSKVQFAYDPVSIGEYIAYLRRPVTAGQTADEQIANLESQADWLASVISRRIIGTSINPGDITPEWVLGACPAKDLGDIISTYLTGEKPGSGEKKPQ